MKSTLDLSRIFTPKQLQALRKNKDKIAKAAAAVTSKMLQRGCTISIEK